MTKAEKKYLADTIGNGLEANSQDATWVKAFDVYNQENKTELNVNQIFNYQTVLDYFK